MPIQAHFNKFNKNIYLTSHSEGYKKAKEKDKSIFEEIKSAFTDAGYPVVDTFMQGSFAVNTAINSLDGDFDIDRAIVIDADKAPEDPIAPKNIIKEILDKRNFKDPRIKKPCVTADYKSINLHIDYTVYKKETSLLGNDTYYLAVGKNGSSTEHKEWSEADQKGLIEWIDSVDDFFWGATAKRKQLKRLIRYIKRWRDVNFNSEEVRKKVFSIGLTIMVKEQYCPNSFSAEVDDDLQALKNTVDAILDADYISAPWGTSDYRVSVRLPKVPKRDIFQHKVKGGHADGSDLTVGAQLRNKLLKLQEELKKALDETDERKQCEVLNKVFGDDFEVPKEEKQSSSNAASTLLTTGAAPLSTAGASGTSQGA
ncbi:nucleotidyltransferase [Vibrio parahaemolyticus]|uniref:nucleotidyltransferase domain-containing protein n=1 Tax=Vibrio TaxID=662 RepID=UPI000B7782C6|nr:MULTISPECIES: nucleotidyltransferase [Vibrio]EJG1189531.1 nucleotidyltransferase [Vibrio parahaemolyticus]EKY4890507.1 nucleotidyltransferase [Vibrio parahaemolyticus]OXD02319.1 nucleotidyltransferase [Vibrio parahaemolyticus]WNJ71248.1 nucleotidyltransferase [Vibrio vulnificus]